MNWGIVLSIIKKTISKNLQIDSDSEYRIVIEIPPYKCKTYDYFGAEGYKIQIGKTASLEVPINMIKNIYESSMKNNRTYNNSVFKSLYPRQLKNRGCHVQVIGKIFEKSGIAVKENKDYKLL